MANNVTEFRGLNDRHRKVLDILTEMMWSTEVKDVTIEDGSLRPTLAKFLSQHLATQNTYASYEEGLSAAGDNGFFAAPGDDGDYLVGYLVRNGNVSVIGRLPSGDKLDRILSVSNFIGFSSDNYALVIRDIFDNIAATLGWDGDFSAATFSALEGFKTGKSQIHEIDSDNAVEIAGEDHELAAAIDRRGFFHIRGIRSHGPIDATEFTVNGNPLELPSSDSDSVNDLVGLIHFGTIGQSQETGATGRKGGVPDAYINPISTSNNKYAVMFNEGPRDYKDTDPNVNDNNRYNVVPLIEKKGANTSRYNGPAETTASGFADKLGADYIETSNYGLSVFATNSALPDATIAEISEGTGPYDNLMNMIERVYNYAQSRNLPYSMPMLFFWQGGSDESAGTSYDDYLSALTNLWAGVREKVGSITGESLDEPKMPMCIVQTVNFHKYSGSVGAVGKAHLTMAEDHGCFIFPDYFATTNHVDNVHHDNITYRRVGVYRAIALREKIIKGRDDVTGVRPIKIRKQGKLLLLDFATVHGPLQWSNGSDDFPIADIENYGFTAVDHDGNDIAISNVSIVSDNTVCVSRQSGSWSSTDRIQYAVSDKGGNYQGREGGQRGQLFDSNGKRDKMTIMGFEFEFNFPCVQFDKEVN
ncbi:hypothetical protein R84981_000990 [Carnimonas sp. R-84981]|uniref:hypothetical protein n=1 Tax=Carnimonas bestiolae TaxID=3402172 RepID=UPI003EDC195B